MKRRDFLHVGMSGAALAAAGTAACRPAGKETALPGGAAAVEPFELEGLSIAELSAGMDSGRFTARSLTELYLERIDKIDKAGPALNAVIEVNPEARAVAEALDAERKAGRNRGPLHGLPVLIKENIATSDRMETTAGSLALAGSVPPADAFCVRRLREAGAVLLGKTNLSEWANFRSTLSTSGWSGRGGQTRNPYALDRNPCGSSSGSGVAAAAGLCFAAVGTETDGSVVCPATTNGIVGIKPTLGLISRTGIVPIAHSQDTAGPMARTVADAAALLSAMAGPDAEDAATRDARAPVRPDYTKFLDPDGLKGARIGVVRKLFGFHDKVDGLMGSRLEDLRKLGAVLVDPVEFENAEDISGSEYEVLLYEFKAGLSAYLAWLGPSAPVRSLEEIIEFNERHRDREMPFFGQEIFLQAAAKGPLTDKAYLDALAKNLRVTRTEGIDALMDKHRLDALVAPTGGPAWTTDLVNGDHYTGGGCSTYPAVSGYPHITVPGGYVFGLPVGLSFFGRAWSEPTLIKLAYAFEQATGIRRPPEFRPTADLSA
jgi:amidase